MVRFVVNSFLVAGLITFGQIVFTGSIFSLPGLQSAVYAGDGNYDDSGRGNDYFNYLPGRRMELAGFLSGTDRAISHLQWNLCSDGFIFTFHISLRRISKKIDGCSNLRLMPADSGCR